MYYYKYNEHEAYKREEENDSMQRLLAPRKNLIISVLTFAA